MIVQNSLFRLLSRAPIHFSTLMSAHTIYEKMWANFRLIKLCQWWLWGRNIDFTSLLVSDWVSLLINTSCCCLRWSCSSWTGRKHNDTSILKKRITNTYSGQVWGLDTKYKWPLVRVLAKGWAAEKEGLASLKWMSLSMRLSALFVRSNSSSFCVSSSRCRVINAVSAADIRLSCDNNDNIKCSLSGGWYSELERVSTFASPRAPYGLNRVATKKQQTTKTTQQQQQQKKQTWIFTCGGKPLWVSALCLWVSSSAPRLLFRPFRPRPASSKGSTSRQPTCPPLTCDGARPPASNNNTRMYQVLTLPSSLWWVGGQDIVGRFRKHGHAITDGGVTGTRGRLSTAEPRWLTRNRGDALRLVYTYDANASICTSHVWTGTTQVPAQARVPFSFACACVVPVHTWLMLALVLMLASYV